MPFSTEALFQPPLCTSSRLLEMFQLLIYAGLCVSLAVRYRHHIFTYFYGRPDRASTPRHPYETVVFLLVEIYVLSLAAVRLLNAFDAEPEVVRNGINFTDLSTFAMVGYVLLLEWVEERQFNKYLGRYEERQAMLNAASTSKDKAAGHGDVAPSPPQSLLMSILSKPLSWLANRLPEPTPENVHVRYHFRAAAKGLIAFAFMNIAQQEACQVTPAELLDTTASCVPLTVFLLALFVVRGMVILRNAAKFTKTQLP